MLRVVCQESSITTKLKYWNRPFVLDFYIGLGNECILLEASPAEKVVVNNPSVSAIRSVANVILSIRWSPEGNGLLVLRQFPPLSQQESSS